MKLSAGYVVFDGLETLEGSIKSIRESVDFVLVSYQTVSWGGTKASDDLIPTLQELKRKGLVDEIMEFTKFKSSSLIKPDDVIQSKIFETNKRQSLLNRSLELGATHYLSMDADEFYVRQEFDNAKRIIETERLHATAVKYINYITPTLHQGYSRFKVPFIYEIGPRSVHSSRQMCFSDIDLTRGLYNDAYSRTKVFSTDEITMHHMEMVRNDLGSKYISSSRFFRDRRLIGQLVDDIENSKKTGVLKFKGIHFGDTKSGNREDKPLFECDDKFGLMTD
jgi:hypothetical protein